MKRFVRKEGTQWAVGFIWRSPAVHLILVCMLGLLVYSNTFHAPFIWDDNRLIVQNPFVRNWNLPSALARGDEELYKHIRQRYITMLSFALNYRISGFRVSCFHAVNLAIHLLNAVLVYLMVAYVFRTPFMKDHYLQRKAGYIALVIAMLFVSHPVQTEAVTYIFQRLASLAAFFYLLSVMMYLKSRLLMQKDEDMPQATVKNRKRFYAGFFYVGALAAAVAGMFTKENTFTIPFVIVICEIFFFRETPARRGKLLFPFALTAGIIPLNYLYGLDRTFDSATREYSFITQDRSEYLFTQFRVIVRYIRLLFHPVHQTIDYDFPVYRSFFDTQVFLSFLLLAAIFGAGLYSFHRSRTGDRGLRLVAFGIFWFFITLSVESSFVPLRLLICEYRVYLPSAGFFLMIVALYFMVMEKMTYRLLRIAASLLIGLALTGYAGAAYQRNATWSDEETFWKDTIRESPRKFVPYYNLGGVYFRLGQYSKAAEMFDTALKLNPNYHAAYWALGRVDRELGLFDEAEKKFRVALMLRPDYFDARRSLGLLYDDMGRFGDAVMEYQELKRINPNSDTACVDLGTSYYLQRKFDMAIAEFRAALKLNSRNIDAINNIGVIYDERGRYPEAIREFQTAAYYRPDDVRTRENLGIAYYHSGHSREALGEFAAVLAASHDSPIARRYIDEINARFR